MYVSITPNFCQANQLCVLVDNLNPHWNRICYIPSIRRIDLLSYVIISTHQVDAVICLRKKIRKKKKYSESLKAAFSRKRLSYYSWSEFHLSSGVRYTMCENTRKRSSTTTGLDSHRVKGDGPLLHYWWKAKAFFPWHVLMASAAMINQVLGSERGLDALM